MPATRLHVRREELPGVQGEDGHRRRGQAGRSRAQDRHRVVIGEGGENSHIMLLKGFDILGNKKIQYGDASAQLQSIVAHPVKGLVA